MTGGFFVAEYVRAAKVVDTSQPMGYYDDQYDYAGRVLWGRIGVFGVALLLMFLLGRCTAPEGVSQTEFNAANAQIEDLEGRNSRLQEQIAAMAAGADDGTDGTAAPATDDDSRSGWRTYIVRSGDTLISIAQEVYGDGTKFNAIADANGIDQNNKLRVGQELQIPPAE